MHHACMYGMYYINNRLLYILNVKSRPLIGVQEMHNIVVECTPCQLMCRVTDDLLAVDLRSS